jgi:uncharacterized protein
LWIKSGFLPSFEKEGRFMLRKDAPSEERRAKLLRILKESSTPVKAAELANLTGVSRQVIVQDMGLLRAREEPIIATSQGYIYSLHLPSNDSPLAGVQRIIYTKHSPEDMEKELNILVDHGVVVLDVGIEHSVYGKITRPLGLKTRYEVKKFTAEMQGNDATLLSSMTEGLHQHTLQAPDTESLERACQKLAEEGFLILP